MTVDAFRRFLRARPFEAFSVHIADGRVIRVRHPDAVVLSPSGRTVSMLNDDNQIEVVDVLLVTSLRPFNDIERKY